MTRTEDNDLDIALDFIIGQITEQALRSGQPLNQDEQFLLANLPRSSTLWGVADAEDPFANPRDSAFEKLCTLAKSARMHDLSLRPDAAVNWQFAMSVLKLHGHPMLWLLQWAGIKDKKPQWDRWLLFFAAFLLVAGSLIGMVIADRSGFWIGITLAIVLVGFACLLLPLSQRLEHRQLRRAIERGRSYFAG
jgi:hypothetical protein